MPPAGRLLLTQSLSATPQDVRRTLAGAVAALDRDGICRTASDLIEVVLAEVLNNIVEHAYQDRADGRICLDIARDGDMVYLGLRDRGRAMPEGRPPPARTAALDVMRDDLPEGGFGWLLIRRISHSIAYRRDEGENRMRIGLDLTRLDGP